MRRNGTSYTSSTIDHSANLWPDPVNVGKCRNDGLNRVFINSQHGKVEYTYSGGVWNKRVIDTTVQRGDILVARLKADGLYSLYHTFTSKSWGSPTIPKGPLREYTWNNQASSYNTNIVVDAVTGATAKMDAGNGRNDQVARMYTPDYGGGKILEITSTTPMIYATPGADLALSGIQPISQGMMIMISNLTANCEYHVDTVHALGGKWSDSGSFLASSTTTNWLIMSQQTSMFYRVRGLPQMEP